MSEYRYLFADVLTNQINAELPLTAVTFGQELNTAGPFQGQIQMSGYNSVNYDIQDYTIPGKTALYVDRDGTIVWAGMIWSRSWDSVAQTVTFAGREFESYFEHRKITFDYNVVGASIDQLTVAQQLFASIQAVPNGNIGVQIPNNTSGVLTTKTYNYFDYKPLTEAIYELSRATNGFDWNIDVNYDGSGNIVKTLETAYPRRGTVYNANNPYALTLEFPGNIISYTYPEDGSSATNTMYGFGAGSGAQKLISTQSSTAQLAAGWPVLENTVSYTDYYDQAPLDAITNAALNAAINPVVVMTVTMPTYVDPILGLYRTGDDFRIRITDDRFPNGLDIVRRLSKYDVTVGDNGPEQVVFSFVVTTN